MRKALLSLLRRRIDTEFLAGTPPAKTLEIVRQMTALHSILDEEQPIAAPNQALVSLPFKPPETE